MKVILTPNIAYELYYNEDLIKNQEGPYRPQIRQFTYPGIVIPVYKWVSMIKSFPLEKSDGKFIQEREVIPGMEKDVDDIALAKIDNGKFIYSEGKVDMKNYSILIYTPKLDNKSIFLTSDSLPELFEQLKVYNIGKKDDTSNISINDENFGVFLDRIFGMYVMGICTYIFFEGENISRCGKWSSKLGY